MTCDELTWYWTGALTATTLMLAVMLFDDKGAVLVLAGGIYLGTGIGIVARRSGARWEDEHR